MTIMLEQLQYEFDRDSRQGCGDEKIGIWSTQAKDLFSAQDCDYGSQDDGWNLSHMQTNPDGTRTLPPTPKGWEKLWK